VVIHIIFLFFVVFARRSRGNPELRHKRMADGLTRYVTGLLRALAKTKNETNESGLLRRLAKTDDAKTMFFVKIQGLNR